MDKQYTSTHKPLIEKSKDGDRKAQYELYMLYVDAMYNVSLRIVKIKEDAEDLIQDSFVDAFKHLTSFRYESSFGAWLKRIVINKSINYLKLKKIPLTSLDEYDYHITEEEIPVDETALDVTKIKKGIEALPSGYQQIINLYLIEGYDHREIGEILGITSSTSKSQYHRAKKKLVALIG